MPVTITALTRASPHSMGLGAVPRMLHKGQSRNNICDNHRVAIGSKPSHGIGPYTVSRVDTSSALPIELLVF